MKRAFALVLGLAGATTASAHFAYIVPSTAGSKAWVIFGDSLEPDTNVPIDRIAATTLVGIDEAGRQVPVKLTKGAHRLTADVGEGRARVIGGFSNYGFHQSEHTQNKPCWLKYYPKAIFGDPATAAGLRLGERAPVEIVPVLAGGTLRFQVVRQGKPLAGAEVGVLDPSGESTRTTTDDTGTSKEAFDKPGRYGVRTSCIEKSAGVLDGNKYEEVRHYATLVLDFGTIPGSEGEKRAGSSGRGPAVEVMHRYPLLPGDMRSDRKTPSLAVDGRGRLLLAWASQSGDAEYTLFLVRSVDGGSTFVGPVAFRTIPLRKYKAVMGGHEMTVSTNVQPRLAAHGDTISLGWTEPHANGAFSKFFVAQSRDGGQTFTTPVCMHGLLAQRPGFTALALGADGVTACAWLESRNDAQQPFCSLLGPNGALKYPETLVYAGPEDKGVCPCCDLAVARTRSGATLVAFRNALGGHRDIWIARASEAGGSRFEPPVAVAGERWRHRGCPHDGPALTVAGDRVHVMWMDAHSGRRQVYLASAAVTDLQFTVRPAGPPVAADQGHPQLIATEAGVLHAAWEETLPDDGDEPGGRAIVCAVRPPDRADFVRVRPVAPRTGVYQTHPALAATPSGSVYVAWNERSERAKSIVFARLAP